MYSTETSSAEGKRSVRVLICSANLGNAQPDNNSLNAWIPSDGFCEIAIQNPPKFPVILDHALTSDFLLQNSFSLAEGLKAAQAEANGGPPPTKRESSVPSTPPWAPTFPTDETAAVATGDRRANNSKDKRKEVRNSIQQKEVFVVASAQNKHDSFSSLNKSHMGFSDDKASKEDTAQQQSEEDNYDTFLATQAAVDNDAYNPDDEYEAFLATQAAAEEQAAKNPDDDYEAMLAAQAQNDDVDQNGDAGTGDADDEYANFLEAQKKKTLWGFMEAKSEHDKNDSDGESVASSVPPPADCELGETFPTWTMDPVVKQEEEAPPTPDVAEFWASFSNAASLEQEEVTPPSDAAASLLKDPSLKQEETPSPTPAQKERFDIIVIGMQEATFDAAGEENGDKFLADDNAADDGSLSSSDEEEETMLTSNNSSFKSTNENNNSSAAKSNPAKAKKSKNLRAKMLEASYKATLKVGKGAGKATLKAGKGAGKATMKVGKATMGAGKATMKAGKATIKAGKAAKTLTTAKNHTSASTPTPQQAMTPLMDGGMSEWTDTVVLHYLFEDQLPSYTRALSYQLGEMRLIVFYLKSAISLDVLSVKTQTTGKAGLANKGGIVAEVAVNQSTRLGFLTAHLEAHEGEEKYATRCSSFRDILHGTQSSVTPCRYDASLASHFMFVMGDLNFRTKLPGVDAGSLEHIQACHELAAKKDWATLNKHDELSKALRGKECLVGFRTPYCNFDPTFKVARQNGYEYNKKRSPSYTDRILFKTGDQLDSAIKTLLYEPIDTFTSSDHKPIRGAFNIELNTKFRWKPTLTKTLQNTLNGKRNSLKASKSSTTRVSRESLHMFVSSIRCHINQTEYNKSRRTNDSKADLPNPFVSFISTPSEAVENDASKKGNVWNTLGLRNLKRSKSKLSTKNDLVNCKNCSMTMIGWPGTTSTPSTFEPNWKNEEIHFKVRTHHEDGAPIDLTGALLHLSVFDYKGSEPKLVGSFSLNLARLIVISREPQEKETDPPLDASTGVPNAAGWSYSEGEGPSTALKGALKKAKKGVYPSPVTKAAKSLKKAKTPQSSVPNHIKLERRSSLTVLTAGPSDSLRDSMHGQASNNSKDDVQAPNARKMVDEKLKELKIVSLKLDEPLTESGKEVGRIRCCIDAWWMDDNDPAKDTSAKKR